jgi:hypothetical protein
MMKGYRAMNKPISPELLAKLKDVEGEGLSYDPKNNPRKIIRLLQEKDEGSKWFPSGAKPGQYLIDEVLCDHFVWTPIIFLNTLVEWGAKGAGFVGTHYALPDDAKWDSKARCYFRTNGNSVEKAAEIVGLIGREVYWQSFIKSALNVARNVNAQALTLAIETDDGPVQLPFYGANWEVGSFGKQGSNGTYFQPTYKLLGTVGEPDGPSGDGFDLCHRVCQLVTRSITPTKLRIESAGVNNEAPDVEGPPESDAPPPTGDDTPRSQADLEDIPF